MSALTMLAANRCFGGVTKQFKHASTSTNTEMTFSVFFPRESEERASDAQAPPVIYYLSGLTCTDQNACTKGYFQAACASRGVVIVFPDTSPRGANIEGETESWDFGVGAGFYLNATTPKWSKHYNMYSYIHDELPTLLKANFPTQMDHKRKSISGHSMGGHGAMTIALKNPGEYAAVSAFSPICNPMNCPWGVKAFTGYLGEDKEQWRNYDSSELVRKYKGPAIGILVDQGTADSFLTQKQLLPESLVEAAKTSKLVSLQMRMQDGYDHSYYFISTFAKDHVDFHADAFDRAARL